jgi:flagellar motor switch protein FliM
MAEAKQPAAAGGESDTVEWSPDAAAKPGDATAAAGAPLLEPEEIDGLLRAGRDGAPATGVAALINNATVTYERLPMLEVVFDRLVRILTTSLRNFTSENVELSLEEITSLRFGDYIDTVPLPAIIAVFKAVEWDNYGLLSLSNSLIYSTVDVLLGGRRGMAPTRIEGRQFTSIERSLIERLIRLVLADLGTAFEPLSAVEFRYERLETNPRFACGRPTPPWCASCACRSTTAAARSTYSFHMRRSSPCAICCCRCSWARSSVGMRSGRVIWRGRSW